MGLSPVESVPLGDLDMSCAHHPTASISHKHKQWDQWLQDCKMECMYLIFYVPMAEYPGSWVDSDVNRSNDLMVKSAGLWMQTITCNFSLTSHRIWKPSLATIPKEMQSTKWKWSASSSKAITGVYCFITEIMILLIKIPWQHY